MDISKLTLGEIATIEQLSGKPFAELADEEAPKGAILAALAYVIKKREDKSYTIDQARSLTMEDINDLMSTGDAEKKE